MEDSFNRIGDIESGNELKPNTEEKKPAQDTLTRVFDYFDNTTESFCQTVLYGSDVNKTGISMGVRSAVGFLRRNFKLIIPLKVFVVCVIRPLIFYLTNNSDSSLVHVWVILIYIIPYLLALFMTVILLLFLRQFTLNPSLEDQKASIIWSNWHGSEVLSFKQTGTVCDRREEEKRFLLKQATESVYRDSFTVMIILLIPDANVLINCDHNSALIGLGVDLLHLMWLITQTVRLHHDTRKYLEFVSSQSIA